MIDQVNYSSAEVKEAIQLLNESKSILSDSVKSSLVKDFTALSDLFGDGLSKLTSQVDSLISSHDSFISQLNDHDAKMREAENNAINYVQQGVNNYYDNYGSSNGNASYTVNDGVVQSVEPQNIQVSDVNSGTSVSNGTLIASIPELNFADEKVILESLTALKDVALEQLLLVSANSGIVTALLKQMFGDKNVDINTKSTLETQKIQKLLLEKLAGDSNVDFAKFDESTILVAIKEFKSIAKKNNITVGDLLIEESNSKLLAESLVNIYSGNVSNMSDSELTMFRKNIDNIASINKITVEDLLTEGNMKLIRNGGAK